jgi:hypothetical protein
LLSAKTATDKKKKGAERRTSCRKPPSAIPTLKKVSLSSGLEVTLINISRGGALIESNNRICPTTTICLRMVTAEGVYQLFGRVLRSRVCGLGAGLRYQSAVAFHNELPLLLEDTGVEARHEAPAVVAVPSSVQPEPAAAPLPVPVPATEPCQEPCTASAEEPATSETDEILTLTACVPPLGPDLRQMFSANNW